MFVVDDDWRLVGKFFSARATGQKRTAQSQLLESHRLGGAEKAGVEISERNRSGAKRRSGMESTDYETPNKLGYCAAP